MDEQDVKDDLIDALRENAKLKAEVERLRHRKEKVKEALTAFKALVDAEECECDGYNEFTCRIHYLRELAKEALLSCEKEKEEK